MTYQRAAGRCEADMNISIERALGQPVEGKMRGHSGRNHETCGARTGVK